MYVEMTKLVAETTNSCYTKISAQHCMISVLDYIISSWD